MNLNPLLSRFMDLVTYDKTVHETEDQIDVLVESIFALEEEQIQNKISLEKERDRVRSLKKEVDASELDMKILDQKVTLAKVKFSTASNAREYEMLKKEVESASQTQHEFEDTLLTAWAHFEAAQKGLHQKEAVIQERMADIEKKLVDDNQKKDELQVLLDVKKTERLTKEEGLPEQWVKDYSRMRKSVPNPVVPLENGACSACFESLTVNQVSAVMRKQLSPCHGCFRFLFIKP